MESLEQRQVMTGSMGLVFDSYYQVPVLAIYGTGESDVAGVEITPDGQLKAHLYSGDTNQYKEYLVNLSGGKYSPGYIFFSGYAGNDKFTNATSIPSLLQGWEGNDTLLGGSGPDRISGGLGSDTIEGRDGDDEITGGPAELAAVDTVKAGAGNDWVVVASGRSHVYGGPGNDFIMGGNGQDVLRGEGGNDSLLGKGAVDILIGGSGDDKLSGGLDGVVDYHYGEGGVDTHYSRQVGEEYFDTDEQRLGEHYGDNYAAGEIAYQGPAANWEAEVQRAFKNGNARPYEGTGSVSSGLTVDEGLSAQFLVTEMDFSAFDWNDPVNTVDNFFGDLAEAEFAPEAIEAGDSFLGDAEQAAINDEALLALLAESTPSITDSEPNAPVELDELMLIDWSLFGETEDVIGGYYVEQIPVNYDPFEASEALLVDDSQPLDADSLFTVSITDLDIGNYYEQDEALSIEPTISWGPQDPILESHFLAWSTFHVSGW